MRRDGLTPLRWIDPADEPKLRALCDEAFALKASPYFDDAIRHLVGWWEERYVRRYNRVLELRAREQRGRVERLVALLRDTDPACRVRVEAAR